MATSLLFRINKFILLEYIYSGSVSPIIRPTSSTSFRRISNAYVDNDTIVNQNGAATKNVIDYTVVDLDNGKFALLDIDTAYFYPNLDSNITVSNVSISPSLNVKYDKIRVHILSGYNFDGIEGFILSIYARMNNDKLLRLCNLSHINADFERLFFNPKPLKLAEFIFDKYVEFEVPAQEDILAIQEASPGSTTNLSYYLTNGKYLANQQTIYCEFHDIKTITQESGATYYDGGEAVRFAFSSTDQFSLLTTSIQQADDGDYFIYNAAYNSQVIEDFIYQLNSLASNKYYIIHDIRVLEQVGNTFNETDNFTSIQTDKYSDLRTFRPVLKLADTATSFSLEYTMRLYNAVDGKSIFKTSTLTSTDINRYGKKAMKLNVGNTTQPVKIYNKIIGNPIYNITDNLLQLTKTKVLNTFIENNDIVVKSDSDLDNSSAVLIQVTPFDNFFKFNLSKLQTPGDLSSGVILELDNVSDYFMVFIKNDQTKVYIKEFLSDNFNKSNGELGFRLTKQQTDDVRNISNNNEFYVISKNPDGIETSIFSGNFKVKTTVQTPTVTSSNTTTNNDTA